MFHSASITRSYFTPQTAENLADSLCEMGEELLRQKQYEMAAKWLQRAYEILMGQELEKLSADAMELRTCIVQCHVKALLGLEQPAALEKATNLVCLLETEVGDKLIVILMRLEILSSSANNIFDSDHYSLVLQKMIRTTVLSEANFKLIMHHIRKLHDKSPSMACKRLDELLQTRVFHAGNHRWVADILINRLWMTISQRNSDNFLEDLKYIFETIASNVDKAIDPSATHAAQTVSNVDFLEHVKLIN